MIYKLFFLILFCFLSCHAHAAIGVSPIIVDLVGKDADAEVAVRNLDTKNNAYVEITAYHLDNPSDHAAPKKRVSNPAKDGLIIFPAKLVLLPGQTQFVRIIKTAKSLATDKVYEVDFIPKVSSLLVNQKTPEGIALGVRVIIGYGVRVTIRPDSFSPAITMKRTKKELVIKNTGNTLVNITSCSQQISGRKTEIPLPAYTLYAGQKITQLLSQQAKVTLEVAFMGKPLGPFFSD